MLRKRTRFLNTAAKQSLSQEQTAEASKQPISAFLSLQKRKYILAWKQESKPVFRLLGTTCQLIYVHLAPLGTAMQASKLAVACSACKRSLRSLSRLAPPA